ncbi:MAG TPA: hypothetical protein VMM76_10105 [Pirellulaceae bacterium]|nr:hypothetical protein [Pirellulaceae bacterium]
MRKLLLIGFLLLFVVRGAIAQSLKLDISTPMSPPTWALLERELLRANTSACEEFFAKYFDERGFLLCVERWGGDDGPDDAIENCNDWPLLHALGASDVVLRMYKKAWEGHLRQYTLAKTTEVPFAKDGMYYKEFPVMFDWLHNGEGLTVFNLQGLSDPNDLAFQRRVRRFAGFYMNEDPGAPNYDAEHKLIRSMFNGSRGPLLRKATALDWAGDPIEIKNRFRLGHGEESYEQMLAHFQDYNDIIGDLPQNLLTTSLALNGYMLSGEQKYRAWLLEYVDAWVERMKQNGYIIPSNIGLDGKIGGATDGKWYGGCYGWAFTVVVPQDGSLAHRNTHNKGFTGFMNAYMLTGDDRYLDPWRRQIDKINAQVKMIDGRAMYPKMYGDDGWYHYTPEKYNYAALELYYLSMRDDDLAEVLPEPVVRESQAGYRNNEQFSRDQRWLLYLLGKDADYPEQALRADLARVRQRVAEMRTDETTPDTRLADDPMHLNPASVASLIQLMVGGLHPGHQGNVLQARLRYFDPITRRAGIPPDMAALVDRLTDDEVAVTLVNTNQLAAREIVLQAGGYAEHEFVGVSQDNGQSQAVNSDQLTIKLAPGAGSRLVFQVKRHANQPTMSFPWDR